MQFQKGQSGNPAGRPPKGQALTDVLREKIDKEEIANKLYEMAMGGDMVALKYIYDRIDGKPRESVEHSGPDGGAIHAEIVWRKPDAG